MENIRIGNEEYDVIPPQSVAASKMVTDAYIKAGSPTSPFTKQGEEIMNVIVAVWMDLYPKQYVEWVGMKKEHIKEEMSAKDQVKEQTGRSLVSFPTPVYKLMQVFFKDFTMNDRDEVIKFAKRYPIFAMSSHL
jgi:hypothetical protein